MEKLGKDPAFGFYYEKKGFSTFYHPEGVPHKFNGVSKRLYIATQLLQGMLTYHGRYWQTLSNNDPSENLGGLLPIEAVKTAYEFTDELLKQENGI